MQDTGFNLKRYLQFTECILHLVSRIILKMKNPLFYSRAPLIMLLNLLSGVFDIQVGITQCIDQCLVFGSNFFCLFFIIQG